jgi:E3 ubiquitin-protein ligase RNF216
MRYIEKIFTRFHCNLFRAYRQIDEELAAAAGQDVDERAWRDLKKPRKLDEEFSSEKVQTTIENWDVTLESAKWQKMAIIEFSDAKVAKALRKAAPDAEQEVMKKICQDRLEKDNFDKQKVLGNMGECGCCFDEVPLNRLVHCDADAEHVRHLPPPQRPPIVTYTG